MGLQVFSFRTASSVALLLNCTVSANLPVWVNGTEEETEEEQEIINQRCLILVLHKIDIKGNYGIDYVGVGEV